MDRAEIGFIGIGVLLLLLFIRTPIGVALSIVSFFGIWALTSLGAAWGIVTAVPFNFIGNWSLSAIPMFLLMGYIASSAGITDGAFDAMRLLLRRVPGSLACSSVGASALFASASGSSVASAAAMARIAVPRMLSARYDPSLAAGTIVASGTLGALIPPSILMILYGIFTEQSIGYLFLAGFIPGLLSALLYILLIIARVSFRPSLAPRVEQRATRAEFIRAIVGVWPFPLLIVGVLGGIFAGIFSPTEAGAMGAFFALVIAAARGRLNLPMLRQTIIDTTIGTCTIFLIAIGAVLFTRFMALSGVPAQLSTLMLALSDDPFWIIFQIAILYIILGMFLDAIGMMLLTLPVILPVLVAADVNLIWFGIIVIKLLEIGLVTPPVGLNLYVVKAAVGKTVSLNQIMKGSLWFLGMDIVALALLILFPAIALTLPDLAR